MPLVISPTLFLSREPPVISTERKLTLTVYDKHFTLVGFCLNLIFLDCFSALNFSLTITFHYALHFNRTSHAHLHPFTTVPPHLMQPKHVVIFLLGPNPTNSEL
jgi:hypothetical protein